MCNAIVSLGKWRPEDEEDGADVEGGENSASYIGSDLLTIMKTAVISRKSCIL